MVRARRGDVAMWRWMYSQSTRSATGRSGKKPALGIHADQRPWRLGEPESLPIVESGCGQNSQSPPKLVPAVRDFIECVREPAAKLAAQGRLDYLVFECLEERTIALTGHLIAGRP